MRHLAVLWDARRGALGKVKTTVLHILPTTKDLFWLLLGKQSPWITVVQRQASFCSITTIIPLRVHKESLSSSFYLLLPPWTYLPLYQNICVDHSSIRSLTKSLWPTSPLLTTSRATHGLWHQWKLLHLQNDSLQHPSPRWQPFLYLTCLFMDTLQGHFPTSLGPPTDTSLSVPFFMSLQTHPKSKALHISKPSARVLIPCRFLFLSFSFSTTPAFLSEVS